MIRSTTSALQAFQVMRYGSLLLTGILLVKTGLPPQAVGEYELILLAVSAVTFFWVSGISQGMLGMADRAGGGERSPLFFNAFLFLAGIGVLLSGLAFFLLPAAEARLPLTEDNTWLIPVYILLITPTYLTEQVWLVRERPSAVLAYGAVIFPVQVACVIGPVWLGMGLPGALAGLTAAAGARWPWLIAALRKHARFRVDGAFLRQQASLAWPLAIAALLSGSADYIDGAIVTAQFDAATFAVFRYGARELPLSLLLANALSNAALPRIASNPGDAGLLEDIRSRSLRLMHLLFPLTYVLLLFSGDIFPMIFNNTYGASAAVFNIYLLLLVSRMVFPQAIVIGRKHSRVILAVSLLEVAVNVTASLLLIPCAGLEGVAWGTVIAFTAEKAVLAAYVQRRFGISARSYMPVAQLVLYSSLLAAVYVFVKF